MALPLYRLFLAGEYERGIAAFHRLEQPSGSDYRWAGACQFRLGRVLEARQWLLTALSKGERGANVDLAICLRFEGEFAAAGACLDTLRDEALSPRDAALAYRERAILEQQQGGGQVMALLDIAWSHAVGAERTVQAAVAQSIALVASQQGNDQKAHAYLTFAEQHGSAAGRLYVRLAQAASATYLGQGNQAKVSLQEAERDLTCHHVAAPLLAYRWGQWYRAEGHHADAEQALLRAVTLARAHHQPETEFYAQLERVALATLQGVEGVIRTALARAEVLAQTPQAQAHLQWRKGTSLIMRGQAEGLALLTAALELFVAGGHAREVVRVWLHLVEAHLRLNNQNAARLALTRAAEAHAALGGQHHLEHELRSLKRTSDFLEGLCAEAFERTLTQRQPLAVCHVDVSVQTVTHLGVFVNGQPVRFQLRKTTEILVYLLVHGSCRLTDLQRDLFPDVPTFRSKNYIHQARLELKRLVPGMSIVYCPTSQAYQIESTGIRLTWDIQTLRDAVATQSPEAWLHLDLNVRNFLTQLENEWVEVERERLSRWILSAGLEIVDRWYAQGHHDHCVCVSRKLLQLDPLNEALHEITIRATAQLSGFSAARSTYWECRTLFLQEVGHEPEALSVLGEHLRGLSR